MSKILDKINELTEDFAAILNEQERGEVVEFYADELKEVPERIAKPPYDPSTKVPECITQTFVFSELIDGKVQFYFAVDEQGLTAKSIATMFDEIFSGSTSKDILAVPDDALKEMGLTLFPNLALGRQAGLGSFINTIKMHARKYVDL